MTLGKFHQLWRSDPEVRHGVRLMVAVPYMLWVVAKFEEFDRILPLVDRATQDALVLRCWLLCVPIVLHGLYTWAQYVAGLRQFLASQVQHRNLAIRAGNTIRHPDHGDWVVQWVRKDRVAIIREGAYRVISGTELREWIILPELQ
jgi:hypothetical protein